MHGQFTMNKRKIRKVEEDERTIALPADRVRAEASALPMEDEAHRGHRLTEESDAEAARTQKDRQLDSGNTAYTLYLREIGQTPLITPKQEVELAKRIKKGDETAPEQMIKANLRLVVKIAREYEDYGVPLLDLINEGNIGLMKAVERFDPTKGAKLSTYAAWWIKQAIRRALSNQSKTIRLPVHVGDKLLHIRRAAARLEDELGREPTNEELAEELDTTPARISALRTSA